MLIVKRIGKYKLGFDSLESPVYIKPAKAHPFTMEDIDEAATIQVTISNFVNKCLHAPATVTKTDVLQIVEIAAPKIIISIVDCNIYDKSMILGQMLYHL